MNYKREDYKEPDGNWIEIGEKQKVKFCTVEVKMHRDGSDVLQYTLKNEENQAITHKFFMTPKAGYRFFAVLDDLKIRELYTNENTLIDVVCYIDVTLTEPNQEGKIYKNISKFYPCDEKFTQKDYSYDLPF